MTEDLRLIEDYLPIEAISAEASREKSVRKGHISTLHLWWARRPLVACRAAVYGSLVPADRWVKDVNLKNPPADEGKALKSSNGKKKGLNRKAAKDFVTKLCRYPKTDPAKPEDVKFKRETEAAIVEARRHILEAHADRLSLELAQAVKTGKRLAWVEEFGFNGEQVTCEDIVSGRAPRPRVLDMFAGGGAIPFEALRLGCESYALDLNPVAHIIQLCTLVYPQQYGKPDPTMSGVSGPPNTNGEATWGGLAEEVRYWSDWVLDRVRAEIGDLYPPIPDPRIWATPPSVEFDKSGKNWQATSRGKKRRGANVSKSEELFATEDQGKTGSDLPLTGFYLPVAYLWTRTVRCKNPSCAATIPMVRQTWMRKKQGDYVALRMVAVKKNKVIRFEVVAAKTEKDLGFDPTGFSSGGNATCPFCGAVSDISYVKDEGWNGRMGAQLMAVACVNRVNEAGKQYVSPDEMDGIIPDPEVLRARIDYLLNYHRLTLPIEQIANLSPDDPTNTLGITVRPYGIRSFADLFHARQLASLLSFTGAIKASESEMPYSPERKAAVMTILACFLDRMADFSSTGCVWNCLEGERTAHTFGRHALSMTWDFAESDPFNPANAGWATAVERILPAIESVDFDNYARVFRGSATSLPFSDGMLDAVITDPPYYDNVPYADISDFFYVWLRRCVGHLYPTHFATALTPKKSEAIADSGRHSGSWDRAKIAYEQMMGQAFSEAHRCLRDDGQVSVVYAHKTTLGWSTLVDALRRAGFTVTEAWPLDTEKPGRLRAQNSAALASSIFLVAKKRKVSVGTGSYEDDVQPELQRIVRERVETLWEMGIAGSDLVIACVGAGLRAFTTYEKVEYANGEEVPAEKFLAEVEGVVLDTMMGKLFGQAGATVSSIDASSRFYILWRFVYKISEIDAGEAIVFTYAQHVELDGPLGLSSGKDALVEKKKGKYRPRDYSERGQNEGLGLPSTDGRAATLIDVLHRVLWLMDNSPHKLADFLIEAESDRERLRVLAQALAGAGLSGKSGEDAEKLVTTTVAEQAALGKLLANWKSLVESAVVSKPEQTDKKRGQTRLFE